MRPGARLPIDPLRGLRRLALVTAASTLLLIAMGGAVRATDSGLACPDWPACYGMWIPPADLNIWLEHSHRLWAGVVGLLIAGLVGWTLRRHRQHRALVVLSVTSAVLVLVQAGLGAAVVLFHLRAGLVTSHLGMSLIIVGCLLWIAALARRPQPAAQPTPTAHRAGRWSLAVAALVFGQALLGGQATGRGAAYVYNAVPIWLADQVWTGHAREVIHLAHRAGGYLVAAAVIALAVAARGWARRDPQAPDWLRVLPPVAVALVALQVALGLTNVLTRASVPSAIGHLAGASWLWAVLVGMGVLGLQAPLALRTRRGSGDGSVPQPAPVTDAEVTA